MTTVIDEILLLQIFLKQSCHRASSYHANDLIFAPGGPPGSSNDQAYLGRAQSYAGTQTHQRQRGTGGGGGPPYYATTPDVLQRNSAPPDMGGDQNNFGAGDDTLVQAMSLLRTLLHESAGDPPPPQQDQHQHNVGKFNLRI